MLIVKIWLKELIQVLKNKPYKIALNPQYDGCQIRLESIVYKLL